MPFTILGLGCAQPFKPGVYTRIGGKGYFSLAISCHFHLLKLLNYSFLVYPEWILENTQDAEWCQKKSTRQH